MRTIRAPLRPRLGGRAPVAAAELLLPVLTVVSGLQLLRLMVSTVVGVYRDRLGASLAGLALFAGCVVTLGLLAAPLARRIGRGRTLVVGAAGVALVRLALQLVPDTIVRWLLAPVGVVLFLWFLPLWLRRDGRGFGLALPAGLAADTALAGLFGSWDYAWSIAGWTVALAGEPRTPVVVTALAGLAVAVAEDAAVPAGLLGQAATAVLVVVIVRRATEPASGGLPGPERRDGLGRAVAAWTAGMGLFMLLVFGYDAVYDMVLVLPVGNRPLL